MLLCLLGVVHKHLGKNFFKKIHDGNQSGCPWGSQVVSHPETAQTQNSLASARWLYLVNADYALRLNKYCSSRSQLIKKVFPGPSQKASLHIIIITHNIISQYVILGAPGLPETIGKSPEEQKVWEPLTSK